MKYADLVKILSDNGYVLIRHGHNHDIFKKGKIKVPIPRHREISEGLAKEILKQAGLK